MYTLFKIVNNEEIIVGHYMTFNETWDVHQILMTEGFRVDHLIVRYN